MAIKSTGFTLDTTTLDTGLSKLSREVPEEVTEKTMGRTMLQVLRDCIQETPTAPIAEGTLRGSGSIFVANRLIGTSEDKGKGKGKGTPAKNHNEPQKAHSVVGIVGFNTAYAHRLHEHPEYDFKDPGAGGKYIEAKLHQFGPTYISYIAKELKKWMDSHSHR